MPLKITVDEYKLLDRDIENIDVLDRMIVIMSKFGIGIHQYSTSQRKAFEQRYSQFFSFCRSAAGDDSRRCRTFCYAGIYLVAWKRTGIALPFHGTRHFEDVKFVFLGLKRKLVKLPIFYTENYTDVHRDREGHRTSIMLG